MLKDTLKIPLSDFIILLAVIQRLKPAATITPGSAEFEGQIVIDYGPDDMTTLEFSWKDAEILDNLQLHVEFRIGYAEVREAEE